MDPDRVQCAEKFRATFSPAILCLLATLFFFSCKQQNKWIEVDPAYSQFVDAYTTGVVSKSTPISIQLAAATNTTHSVGEEVSGELFDFSPAVKGKARWVNARTIEFKPDAWLETDQQYDIRFKLGKITKVPAKFQELKFSIKTVKPSFKVT